MVVPAIAALTMPLYKRLNRKPFAGCFRWLARACGKATAMLEFLPATAEA